MEPGADFNRPRDPRFMLLAGRNCFTSDAAYRDMLVELKRMGSDAAAELLKLFDQHLVRKATQRPSQRGFGETQMLIVVAAIAFVLLIWGAVSWHASKHFKLGEDAKQGEWDAANRKAEAKAATLRAEQQSLLDTETRRRQAAEAAAADYEHKWKEARNASRRKPGSLAVVDCNPRGPAAPGAGAEARSADSGVAVRLRLTWEFVGLHDSAWTGEGGQPLFGDPAGLLAQAGAADPLAPSPYGLDELLDTHKENAARCSADRRQLNALIDVVEKLRAQWDRLMR